MAPVQLLSLRALRRRRRFGAERRYKDSGATLDDLREAVATLEDAERIVRRVFGGSHPFLAQIEGHLQASRAVLRAREAGRRVVFETIPRHRRDE